MMHNFSFLHIIKHIAIVGLSPDPQKDSHKVAKYLQENGFEIYPIYPKESEILGRKVYRNLLEVPCKIDMVVMFRKGEHAENLIYDIIKKGVKFFWLQLGITNKNSKIIAEQNGIEFVQDRCIMIEHRLLKQAKTCKIR